MKSCRDRSHASMPDLTPVNLDCASKYASSVELAPSIPRVPPYGLRELQQNFEKTRRENFSLKVEVCFLKSKLQELGYFSELPENQLVHELETFKKFLSGELNAENKISNESDICQKVELVEVSKSIAVKEKELENVKDENAHLKSVIVSLRKENELLLESLQNAGESVYESDHSGRISLMTRKDALIFKLKNRIVELEMDLMKQTSMSLRLEEKEDVESDSNLKIPETLHVATQTSFIQESPPACSSVSTVDHTSREEAQLSSEMRLICNYLDEVSAKAEYIFFVLKKIVGSSKNVDLLSESDRNIELNALNFPVLFDNLCTMLDGSIHILNCSNNNNNNNKYNNGNHLHYYLNSLDEKSDRRLFEDDIHHLKEQVKHLQRSLCEKEKFIANMMKKNSRKTAALFHSNQSKIHYEAERFNEVLFDLNKSLANIRNSNALMASRLKLTDGAIAVLMENKLSKMPSQTLKKTTLQRNVDASDETDVMKDLNGHLKVRRDSCYERKIHNKCKNYIIRE